MPTPFVNQPRLTLEAAQAAGQAALDLARARGWEIAIVVVDYSGVPVFVARMTGAILASHEGAHNKAVTALKFARPTKALEDLVAKGRMHYLTFDNMLCVEGGLPIVVNGATVGAIGVGGGPSGREAAECAKAGLAALGLDAAGL